MRVLFVHGAVVADAGWWWRRMVGPLCSLGFDTAAVELPSCSAARGDLHADGDAVRAVLDGSDEPVVLVGHSYGGMVITDASDAAHHLVYVTAMLPDAGESLQSMADPRPPGWLEPIGDGAVRIRSDLTDEQIRFHFTGDCDAATAAAARTRLVPQSAAVFGQPPRRVAWRSVPSTFVLCTEDRATLPAVQAGWSQRAGRVVEIPTGHHPFLSRPVLLAQVIADAARGGV